MRYPDGGGLTAAGRVRLTAIIKNRLKSIQYRPALIDAFLAQAGLTPSQNLRRPQPSGPGRR
jgi:hypothetical protein